MNQATPSVKPDHYSEEDFTQLMVYRKQCAVTKKLTPEMQQWVRDLVCRYPYAAIDNAKHRIELME